MTSQERQTPSFNVLTDIKDSDIKELPTGVQGLPMYNSIAKNDELTSDEPTSLYMLMKEPSKAEQLMAEHIKLIESEKETIVEVDNSYLLDKSGNGGFYIDRNGVLFHREGNENTYITKEEVGDKKVLKLRKEPGLPKWFIPPADHVLIGMIPIPREIAAADGII